MFRGSLNENHSEKKREHILLRHPLDLVSNCALFIKILYTKSYVLLL